ncbi:hypothetical protein GCM10027266_16500 [Arenimonas alkanexedens]
MFSAGGGADWAKAGPAARQAMANRVRGMGVSGWAITRYRKSGVQAVKHAPGSVSCRHG